jgi:hypothetical protein
LRKFQLSPRTENFPIPILGAQREMTRFQVLPRSDNCSPAPAGVLSGTFSTASRDKVRITSQGEAIIRIAAVLFAAIVPDVPA